MTIGHFSCGILACVTPWEPPHSLEGILVCVCMKCTFSAKPIFSLPATHIFSRSRLRGTQGARLYTTLQVYVLAGLRGARSGRSKSRNMASNRGIVFRPARGNHAHRNQKQIVTIFFFSFFLLPLMLFFKYHSSYQRLDSRGTTAALQAFPFVTATAGASACGFVCVRVCACVSM